MIRNYNWAAICVYCCSYTGWSPHLLRSYKFSRDSGGLPILFEGLPIRMTQNCGSASASQEPCFISIEYLDAQETWFRGSDWTASVDECLLGVVKGTYWMTTYVIMHLLTIWINMNDMLELPGSFKRPVKGWHNALLRIVLERNMARGFRRHLLNGENTSIRLKTHHGWFSNQHETASSMSSSSSFSIILVFDSSIMLRGCINLQIAEPLQIRS